MKVAAHEHGKEAIDNCIRLGIDSIEHGTYADEESFRLMKERGVSLSRWQKTNEKDETEIVSGIRIAVSVYNNVEDIDQFLNALSS